MRAVLQTTWDLKGKDKEFNERLPPDVPISTSGAYSNQFLVSRTMIHKRPLHVWKELLQIIAVQPKCHVGEKVKSAENPSEEKGLNIHGHTGEQLSHVLFGHQELRMKPPTQEDICQNFIRGCPGSPCKGPPEPGLAHRTVVVKSNTGRHPWWVVLHEGKRHNVPDMDTLEGLEVPAEDMLLMDAADVKMYPEGPPLTPCDIAWVTGECRESVYYRSIHNITDEDEE